MNVSSVFGKAAVIGPLAAFNFFQTRSDIREARREGKNVAWATASSVVRNNWQNLLIAGSSRPGLYGLALFGFALAPAISSAAYGFYQTRNAYIRSLSTPFSQRFEASSWSHEHQQRGMESILGSRSLLGSEAGSMAARYGRR